MKKVTLLLLISFISFQTYSQVSYGDEPLTWNNNKMKWQSSLEIMPSFDVEALKAEDDINNEFKDTPYRFGKKFILGKNLDNSGYWNYLPNGDRVWIIELESKNALSLNLGFDLFYIPEGASLFVYNEDHSELIGKFDHRNNNAEETFSTWPIFGDRIIVEFFEPKSAKGQSKLQLEYVTHAYRDLNDIAKGIGDSGSCNNDVICPVSAGWENEINSVAMIVVSGNGICTGALVNNVANDEHPYFLTANHCTGGNVSNWTFRFNFQATTCGGSTSQAFNTVSGSTLLASGGSADYALFEINNGNPIPTSYNPYYAGWDATGANPTSQVGVHHPSGDLKKISFDNQAAGTSTFGGATTWQVFNWEDGTTEPGSSGSPLFDQNHRIIGQLYGGQATCNNNVNDYYGKFDVTYPNICTWLNPGCNANFIDGFDPNGTASFNNDAGIQSITEPSGSSCSGLTSPIVTLRNYGLNTLTSVTINYSNIGGASGSYNWTGSLATGTTEQVSLPPLATAPGTYTFFATTLNPNGSPDEDTGNDLATTSHSVISGSIVTLEIDTDCWGGETSWIITDDTGAIIDQISPNTLANQTFYTWDICLEDGCYDLTINDTFGDGLAGIASGCAVDGNYQLTDSFGNTLASLGTPNFGSSVTDNFCLSTGTDGCMDTAACNYNPSATTDDGSCTYPGCTDASACNYDSTAGCNDGSCQASGCADSTACNFDPIAFCDDGSCVFGPTNDVCSGAIALSTGVNNVTNSGACIDEGYSIPGGNCNGTLIWCTQNGIEGDVFYSFTTPASPTVVNLITSFDGTGTWIDTQMAVFDGCGGTLVGANDDGGTDLYMSQLNFDCGVLAPNTTYVVLLDGYAGNSGTCNLTLSFDSSTCGAAGCTDPLACNYDSTATVDDGSCLSNDECGNCGGTDTAGCTDPFACNYDATANCDDGSCLANDACGNCGGTDTAGCTDPLACNYDATADCDDGSCLANDACGNCGGTDTAGCTDPLACNYDATADCDDGSCLANDACGNCGGTDTAGCTDPLACNYDATADCDDGSCLANDACGNCGGTDTAGCTDPLACNYDATADCDDGSCLANDACGNCGGTDTAGCTDPLACNYDATADCDDGSCLADDACGNCGGTDTAGCTDPLACNYDATADCDDGSCLANDACGNCGGTDTAGCTDPLACNYDATADCDDGSCLADDACGNCGGTDTAGCTDPLACNYDATAGCDDGTCVLPDGCTDITACNYDSLAQCDDGSCTYAPCGTCVGDANGDGFVNILDLVSVSSNFGCTSGCLANGDANFDGIVNVLDLISVSSNFAAVCP